MKYKIFLDDWRDPSYIGWDASDESVIIVVRSLMTFIETIDRLKATGALKDVTHISFDHDLNDIRQNKTGYDAITYIEELEYSGVELSAILLCHSDNPDGRRRINQTANAILNRRSSVKANSNQE